MAAQIWRDENGRLRCQRSPGGTCWHVTQGKLGCFELSEFASADANGGEAAARVSVGRTDPETAEQIIKFLSREAAARPQEAPAEPAGA
jgi:hypothetical protein